MPRLPQARKRSYCIAITLGGGVGSLPDVHAACRTAPHRSAPPPATHTPVPSPALLLLCACDITGCRSLPTIALRCDCCALSRGSPVRELPLAAASVRLACLARLMGLEHGTYAWGTTNQERFLESQTDADSYIADWQNNPASDSY
jgi:hypothetical protein